MSMSERQRQLREIIEKTRAEMHSLYSISAEFSEQLLYISQKLDALMNEYNSIKAELEDKETVVR